MKKYILALTQEERDELEALTRKGTITARRLKRALVLLAADEDDADAQIAAKARVSVGTVERIRKHCVEEGQAAPLTKRPRPGKARTLDGHQEAHLLALACSAPPEGRKRWTLQLLADGLVKREVVDAVSDETVLRILTRGS